MPAIPTTIKELFLPPVYKCSDVLARLRWREGGITCPVCGSKRVKKNGRKNGVQCYLCHEHEGTFSVTTGTKFYRSKVGLNIWFYFIFHYIRNEPAKRLGEVLDISYPTALRMAHVTMQLVEGKCGTIKLVGVAEFDELYMSCGSKGEKQQHPRKRGLKLRGRGSSDKDKPPILGGCDRSGRLRLMVAGQATSQDIEGFFLRAMGKMSDLNPVYTDDFTSYWFFRNTWIPHETVNHSTREYARGPVHNNTMEGYWSVCRHWLDTYRGVSKKYLPRYIGFFEFVENNRHEGWCDMFAAILFFYPILYQLLSHHLQMIATLSFI